MYILEALLLTALLLTCLYVSATDIKNGIIENKILAMSGLLCCGFNILYYTIFAREYFTVFLIDFVLLVILSVGMYALNLWAAGDSKLLFLVVFAIPGRFYDLERGAAPAVYIIVFTFSISFIYVVLESIVLRIQKKERIQMPEKGKIADFFKGYLNITVYILAVNHLVYLLFPIFASQNASLIAMADLFLSIMICKYPIFSRLSSLCIAAVAALIITINYSIKYGLALPNLRVYGYIAVIMFFRSIAEQYNFQTIPTAEAKPGMILSVSTVLAMAPSKVAGLPRSTTEDMRSRLTAEQAAAVVRWEHSKYGQPEIMIVRKIPFAVFITLGALTFILFRLGGI